MSTASKKTVLITGATSGIGRHAALDLHERGYHVIGTGRNEKALAELREAGLDALRLDVTDDESIEAAARLVDRLTDGHGLDVLINNAGYGLFGPMEELTDDDIRAQFETNFFGLLAVTRRFLPQMRERGAGRIINVSSVGGRIVFPLAGAYHATKYALEAVSDALRMELRQFGVEVVLIEPGYIETGFTGTTLSLFEQYNDKGSPYAAAYAKVDAVEGSIERFAAQPTAVSRAIRKAIERRRPRARYVAPGINAFGPWMGYLTPTRLLDWVFRRVFGLSRPVALPAGERRPALSA